MINESPPHPTSPLLSSYVVIYYLLFFLMINESNDSNLHLHLCQIRFPFPRMIFIRIILYVSIICVMANNSSRRFSFQLSAGLLLSFSIERLCPQCFMYLSIFTNTYYTSVSTFHFRSA
ncbi:LOW QUALITY PROTEIN: hypothetical protein PanWU01x14_027150 [Parasponia andersonii]|uniref:Transmembrane protein n=1 Tax=Parasponia andersonii TaxID=3476 RepID=A0A2P5DW88_PARAD|nr:LOW QUALITY PROTEIN: hypothetical protein PanWU01x14_027150 [Parasponia andersonii]